MPAFSKRRDGTMLAIDTNVVVRYLTNDHPQQSLIVRSLVESQEVFVASSVLLECDWVLRSVYGYSRPAMANAIRHFAGLPTVVLEHGERLVRVIEAAEAGMDFADALHLSAAFECEAFLTFDSKFIAATKGMTPVVRRP